MTRQRIVGAVVLTPGGVLTDGELEFDADSGVLSYVGPARGPLRPGDVDGRGRLAMPGMVNGHTHIGMGVLRGYSNDVDLHTWLGHMRAIEVRMTADDILAGVRLAMAEMLRTGTIGFVDMFEWTSPLLAAVAQAGMRVNAAPTVFDRDGIGFPSAGTVPGDGVVDAVPALAAEFAGDPRITVSFGLHAPYTCPADLMTEVAQRREQHRLGLQIHLSETAREVQESLAAYGMSPIRRMRELGVLPGRLHVAHAVWPEPGDVELLAGDGVTVSHNPVSNLKLGAGIAPVPEYLAAGVQLGLGTDSVASNNTLDMFEEIKTAVLVQRGAAADPQVISGAQVLAMATSGGAPALGGQLSGRLAVGEQADVVLVDITGTTATPFTDPVAFLCYAARGTDVTDVFVAGRRLVADSRCTTLDEDSLRAEVTERAARLRGELAPTDPRP